MTYQEIQDRLSKCEYSLRCIKDGTLKDTNNKTVKKLELLKESLKKQLKEADSKEVDVFGYQTKHFHVCPGATSLFKALIPRTPDKMQDMVVKLAKHHDILFAIEIIALKSSKAAKQYLDKAIETASNIYKIGGKIGLDQNSDLSYIQNHLEIINDAAREEVSEKELTDDQKVKLKDIVKQLKGSVKGHGAQAKAIDKIVSEEDGVIFTDDESKAKELAKDGAKVKLTSEGPYQTTYIKVSKNDYKKAIQIIDQNIDTEYVNTDIVDNDGDGNVIVYFNFTTAMTGHPHYNPDVDPAEFIYDLSMDLEANGINITSASHDIKDFEDDIDEGPYQTTYIKIAQSDYRKAMAILDRAIDPTYTKMDIVDDDGDGNVIIYFNFRAKDDGEPDEDQGEFIYDVSMDLQSRGVQVVSASHDIDEAKDINDPVLMRLRALKSKIDKKKGISNWQSIRSNQLVVRLKAKRAQVMRDMEQEAEPEGGPIADKYGDLLNKIDAALEKALGTEPKSYNDTFKEGWNDQDDVFAFGYNLDMIQAVIDHLKSNYSDKDYELHVGRGDTHPNAVTLKNPNMESDEELGNLLIAAEDQEETDYQSGRELEKDYIGEKKRPGLWANIRAKKARGAKPAHKNSNAHKDAVKAGEKINKSETKGAPSGHYFTKSGNLVKGTMSADAKERGARKSDPKDKMRSKVPKATQFKEGLWANINAKKKAGKKSSHGNSNAHKDAVKAGNALKQEGDNPQLSKEHLSIIASKAGKAIIQAIQETGDEVSKAKIKKIFSSSLSPNVPEAFTVHVIYKNDSEVSYRFQIEGDKLVFLADGQDIILSDVGNKPSGEPFINTELVKNEMTKYFKQMREMTDSEFAAADEADRLANHPERDKILAIQNLIAKQKLTKETADPQDGKAAPYGSGYRSITKEDKDIGHQDDEPSMLKSSAFETAQYAAKLVKKLSRYDQHDGEVDFPNWWQKKLILAREYMSAAYHYLDSEEKQPAIDQLALEGNMNEVSDMDKVVRARKAIKDLAPAMNKLPQDDPKRIAFITKVKKINSKYKELLGKQDDKISGTGRDQELDEGRGDFDDVLKSVQNMSNNDDISEKEAALEIVYALADKFQIPVDKNLENYMQEDKYDDMVAQDSDIPADKKKGSAKALRMVDKGHSFDKVRKYIQEKIAKTADDVTDPADLALIAHNYLAGFGKEHTLTPEQLIDLGRKIVTQLYKGDIGAALAKHGQEPTVKEYGSSQGAMELETLFGALGYRDGFDDFIEDNPGAVEALHGWISSIPEFRKKLGSEFTNSELEDMGLYDIAGYDDDDEDNIEEYDIYHKQDWSDDPKEKEARKNNADRKKINKDTLDIDEVKVGDTLTKDGKKGKVTKLSDTQATVDFGNGDVYGIAHSRIKNGNILKEAEAKPVPDAIMRGYNINVKSAQTMAQALLSMYNQINSKETTDFSKNSNIKRVLNLLNTISKTKDTETAEPQQEISTADVKAARAGLDKFAAREKELDRQNPNRHKEAGKKASAERDAARAAKKKGGNSTAKFTSFYNKEGKK